MLSAPTNTTLPRKSPASKYPKSERQKRRDVPTPHPALQRLTFHFASQNIEIKSREIRVK